MAVSQDEKLNGLYVIPSAQSSDLWFGVIFVHGESGSPYQGGIFRFTLKFPQDFPSSAILPSVTFQPPIFHPNIHQTRGQFDLRRSFKSGWHQRTNSVRQVLKIVRASFYKVEPSSCLNKTAHDMLENNILQFNEAAQKEVESSLKRLHEDCPAEYNRDIHWMKFSPYDPSLHDQFRRKITKSVSNSSSEVLTTRSGVQKGLSSM